MLSTPSNNKPRPEGRPSSGAPARPGSARPVYAWSFEAIGTSWWIALDERFDKAALERIVLAVERRIEQFDAAYSRFRSDSLVSRWSRQAGEYPMPNDAKPLFDIYGQLYELTEGAMTPLVGQVLSDAGYDADYSLRQKSALVSPPPPSDVWEYDALTLHIKQPVLLDFGAAGKGYLVDIISELLLSHGVARFCIDAGGDIRYHNTSDVLPVGLEHPDDPSLVVGVAHIGGAVAENPAGHLISAICGSSGNRRAWLEFHHIIDPRRLKSPKHLKAVWVTARSALVADALATALFFTDAERLAPRFQFEYAMVMADLRFRASEGFPGHFFNTDEL